MPASSPTYRCRGVSSAFVSAVLVSAALAGACSGAAPAPRPAAPRAATPTGAPATAAAEPAPPAPQAVAPANAPATAAPEPEPPAAAAPAGTPVAASPEPQPSSAGGPGPACIEQPFPHAAQIIVRQYSAEISQRIGRPVTLADYPHPGASCTGVAQLPDLDGDGVAETEITEGCSWGMHGWLQLIYFSNRGCLRYGGALLAGELTPLTTASQGIRDLEATWSNGCAGNDFIWIRYRFDGSRYRTAEAATCELCPGRAPSSPNANRHPICAARKP